MVKEAKPEKRAMENEKPGIDERAMVDKKTVFS